MLENLELLVEQNRQILAALAALRADVAAIKGDQVRIEATEMSLAEISHRFAAMDGRLAHLQTIGMWLMAGLMGSYAAILAVALRIPHNP